MSSHDVREMLNLPSASSAPRPAKKQKITGSRPKITGLARELQMLGGDNPIAIIQDQAPRGRKRAVGRSNSPARPWILKPFTNPARTDGLVLKHWQQKEPTRPAIDENPDGEKSIETISAPSQLGESTFAKFNVQMEKLKYTDEEYESLLRSEDWTREETDYLVDIVAEYDQRWPIIIDRYDYNLQTSPQEASDAAGVRKVRDMEDLKARYYGVSAKMLSHKRPVHSMNEAEYKLHEAYLAFDPTIERRRKDYARSIMQRSQEEAKEEEKLLVELRRIIARTERLNEERSELYARLDAPQTSSNANIAQFTQSVALQQLVAQLFQQDRNKKRKSFMPGEGNSPSINGQHGSGLDRRDSSRQESMSGQGGAGKRSGGGSERRKLTDEEERIYGVTHHDRLTHGSVIRSEKAVKAMNGKSATHAQKVHQILSELELPLRLNMPTQRVVSEFDVLISRINLLLDARKISDKLDAEILLARKQKAEREEEREREATGGVEMRGGGLDSETALQDGETRGENGEGGDALRTSNKRSASVMSAISESSTKRQKK